MWNIERVVKKGDYLYAVVLDHPNRTKNNYVLLHRVIMENHLGRLLTADEIVHHIDGDKFNNNLNNLSVMSNSAHVSMHGFAHGREWAEFKCPWCGCIFSRKLGNTFLQKGGKYTCCSRHCRSKLSSEIQYHGLTHELETAISENLIRVFRKYSGDNSEETSTNGSVETIRSQAETPKK